MPRERDRPPHFSKPAAREDLKEIDLGHKEPDFFKRFLDEGNKIRGIIASKPIILAGLQLTVGEKGPRCWMRVGR